MVRNIRSADPYTITENDIDLTLTDGVANLDAEVVAYRVADREAIKIKRGARFFLYLEDAGAQIEAGQVELVKTTSDKKTHRSRIAVGSPDEFDSDGVPENKDTQYHILKDVVLGAKEYLLVTVNAATVALAANTRFRLDVIKALEWSV